MYNHSTFDKEYLTDILVLNSICDMSCLKKKKLSRNKKNSGLHHFHFGKDRCMASYTAFAIPPLLTPLTKGHISHSNEDGLQNN